MFSKSILSVLLALVVVSVCLGSFPSSSSDSSSSSSSSSSAKSDAEVTKPGVRGSVGGYWFRVEASESRPDCVTLTDIPGSTGFNPGLLNPQPKTLRVFRTVNVRGVRRTICITLLAPIQQSDSGTWTAWIDGRLSTFVSMAAQNVSWASIEEKVVAAAPPAMPPASTVTPPPAGKEKSR